MAKILKKQGIIKKPIALLLLLLGAALTLRAQAKFGNHPVAKGGAGDLTQDTNLSGAMRGTFNNLQINTASVNHTKQVNAAVSGDKIASTGASNSPALQWNGGAWTPGTISGGGYTDNWPPEPYIQQTETLKQENTKQAAQNESLHRLENQMAVLRAETEAIKTASGSSNR